MDRVIGIDLGTTNSVVAYYEQGQPVVIQNAEGNKTTPSVVLYKSPGEIVVGELAKRQAVMMPKQAIRSVKRFMGGRYSELGDKTRGILYDLVEGPDDSVLIDVGWTKVSPEQVAAEILKSMRKSAEDYFGDTVEKAVVTVPAYFNDNQRSATKRAGEIAGLEVVRIINEPTAAALAYGAGKTSEQRIAVFDFGGGTFDVTILEIDRDVFEVKSTHGNTFLGGDNIDELLFEEIASRFEGDTGFDIRSEPAAAQRLREVAERVKCELSGTPETLASLPFIAANDSGPLHLNCPLTRTRFNELVEPLLPGLLDCCKLALEDARWKRSDISNILLVGGSTRIPAVQDLARTFFGREPSRALNPDEAVALGAAIQASIMTGGLREVLLLDVTPLSLGIELAGGMFSVLIPRNSSIPVAVQKNFTTVRDNQSTVRIHVLQGERRKASENHTLGWFRLVGLAPAPKEIPSIDVCFQIDANGLLHVSATEASSGASNSITIESFSTLSEEEAEGVVAAAQAAVEEDLMFSRRVSIKAQADELVGGLTRILGDQENPLEEHVAQELKEALFRFDVAFSSGKVPELEQAFNGLSEFAEMFSDRLLVQRLQSSEDGKPV